MDVTYTFMGQDLMFDLNDQLEFTISDDFQLLGIANGEGCPTAVWVRMVPALDTQLEFDMNGADASDFPE